MDLKQMRYFIALYEEGSITRAAQKMNVVPSAISQQIKRLEDAFSVVLFDRSAQGSIPTRPAHRLYPLCVQTMISADRARISLEESRGRISGRVAIGLQSSIRTFQMGRLLVRYHGLYPDVEVTVREGFSGSLIEGINLGELDFAILSLPGPPEGLDVRTLTIEELAVLTSRETAHGMSQIRGPDLSRLKLVLPSSRNLLRAFLNRQFGALGIDLKPSLELDSIQGLQEVCSNPGWATITPPAYLDGPSAEKLCFVKLIEPTIRRMVFMGSQPHKEFSIAARLLADLIVSSFAEDPAETEA